MRLLSIIAFLACSSVVSAPGPSHAQAATGSKVLTAAERYPFEFRLLAELTPGQGIGTLVGAEPLESGSARGIGVEGMRRFKSTVYAGVGVSVSRLRGKSENVGDDTLEPPEVSGWLWQAPLVLELGFPDVPWGRFSVGGELGYLHAALNNMYDSPPPGEPPSAANAVFFGLRLGYVHWVSDRIGVVLNGGARLGIGTEYYVGLGARLGVSWRL